MGKITLAAVFYNEEEKLPGYFKNVRGVADRMVVVDCSSDDRTAAICRKNGAEVIESPHRYFEQNINKALSKVDDGEWVLIVSADERLSEGLKGEILEAVKTAGSTDVFFMKRINYLYDGFSTRSSINQFEWRLFRKGCVKWVTETPHELPKVEGERKKLKNVMYHYCFLRVEDFMKKTHDYVCKLPAEFAKQGKKISFGERDWRVSLLFGTHGWRMLFLFPAFQVFNHLFLHMLVLDGKRGAVQSIFAGTYAFFEEATYWENSSKKRKGIKIEWKNEYPIN